jgi:hypothetical protein
VYHPKDTRVLYYVPLSRHPVAPQDRETQDVNWSGTQPLEMRYSLSYPDGMGLYVLAKISAHYDKDNLPYLIEERRFGRYTQVKLLGPFQADYQHLSKTPQQVVHWIKYD